MKQLIYVILFFMFSSLQAQQTLVTDRPDQTESASVVGTARIQIESGFLFERNELDKPGAGKEKTNEYLSTLVRVGLNDLVELRVGLAYATYDKSLLKDKQQGFTPLIAGLKFRIADQEGWRPEIAFLGHLAVQSVAERVFRAQYIAPDFRFAFAHDLSGRISLGYNLGMEWDGDNPQPTGIYTLATGVSINDWLGSFIEVYGFLPQTMKPDHRIDMGFTFLVLPDLQFDVSAGFGISQTSPDHFISLGFAWRTQMF
jgi:hypothetical protein